jgi:hypothetical protein
MRCRARGMAKHVKRAKVAWQLGHVRCSAALSGHDLGEEHDLLELGCVELPLEIGVFLHFLIEHDRNLVYLIGINEMMERVPFP